MVAEYVTEHQLSPRHLGALTTLLAGWWVRAYAEGTPEDERSYYAGRLDAAQEILSAIGLEVGRDERGSVVVAQKETGAERSRNVRR